MIGPISRAFSSGYSQDQILKFLINALPQLKAPVKKALKAGYPLNEIMKFINTGFGGRPTDNMTESQIHGQRDQQQNEAVKNALKSAGVAAATYGAFKGIPSLTGTQTPPSPPLPQTTPPNSPLQGNIGPQPMANAPIAPPQVPPVGPAPTGTPTVVPPVATTQVTPQPWDNISPEQSVNFLKAMGLDKKIDNLLSAGNPPETVSEIIGSIIPEPQRKYWVQKIKSGEAKPADEAVKDYLSLRGNARNGSDLPQKDVLNTMDREDLSKPETMKPKKGDLVFDESSGITGQLKDIKNTEALVEDDGKVHKVKNDNLLHSEVPEKDLADLYNDLIQGIEKETEKQVSRSVEFAGYDPEHNELIYRPYLGGVYVYEDIEPEDAELLTSFLTKRKTSGESLIGAWEKGTESPIGAAMSALIKKLQQERGGKGKEYSRKFQTIYSAHEPAQLAAKKKKAEEAKKRKKK